jgi:hypothetical protein
MSSIRAVTIRLYVYLAAAWLISGISYWASAGSKTDWFSRSGAVMCLLSAVINFDASNTHQKWLTRYIKNVSLPRDQRSLEEGLDHILNPSKRYSRILFLSYVSAVVGTAIWGYGDLLR